MKLELIVTGEQFDVPRGLGSALLVIADGKLREPLPPAPRALALNPKSHFSITENLNSEGAAYTIHAKCDNCKNSASCTGLTAHKTFRYHHCGVVETVPTELGARYARMIARSQESQERPRRAPGSVQVI